MPYNLIFVVKS